MAWDGGVREPEGKDAVLEDVGEGEESGFSREDAAELLHFGVACSDAVEFFDAFVSVLGSVSYVVRAGSARPLCEKPSRFCLSEEVANTSGYDLDLKPSPSVFWRKARKLSPMFFES